MYKPLSLPSTDNAPAGHPLLQARSTRAVRTLYYFSLVLQHLTALWLLSFLCTVAMLMPLPWLPAALQNLPDTALLVSLLTLALVTVGSSRRTRWGQVSGILLSLMLVSVFPLGTVFGLIGLVVYVRAGRLFGSGAASHRQLQQEYAQRVQTAAV